MKKLLSLALTMAILASGIIGVAAENTDIGENQLPVIEYIDNWDFDEESKPANAFQALPEFVTTDGVTAAKFDAYKNEKNTGFESSSWKDVTADYVVFDLRIKAEAKTNKQLHLIDSNIVKYNGETLEVKNFNKINLTANTWNDIKLVFDMKNKSVDGNKVSNINCAALIVNGKRYLPVATTAFGIDNRRNYIEPYKTTVDGSSVLTQDNIIYIDYYKTYTTTSESVKELLTDRETYLVSKYIDNWDFSDGSQPTKSWQGLVKFENGNAVFNTETYTKDDGGIYQNPGFEGQNIAEYVNDETKFLVFEFAVKADKKTTDTLRIWDNRLNFNGESLNVPGFGKISLNTGEWHRVVYVLNLESVTVSGKTVTGMKPYLMYIDGDKYKPSNSDTLELVENSKKTWINTKDGNNTSANADIVYMDYYKTYIADADEVEADATYLKTTTKYTPVNMIVNRDFDYKGDLSTGAQGILPVMTTADGKGVVYFNSNNALKADGTYSNIGFYDDVKFADMSEDYVVLETGFKFGNTDAKNICLYGGMIRVVGNNDEAILRLQSDNGNYDTGIDRNVWYDVSLVLDRSTFTTDGNLNAVKLTVGKSEINLENKNIVWKSANKNRNANMLFIENNKANIEFWLDYYKAYTVAKDSFAFGGTSKYTMKDLIYDYEFDVKAGNKFHSGNREAVILEDGTEAIKLTAYSSATTSKNGGFEIYAGDSTGTVAVEAKIMIPENDGAASCCLANIIELTAKKTEQDGEKDTISVSLYGGAGKIAEDLDYGKWHTFEVVVDNDNGRYLTITIDGTKYDIANGFRATGGDKGTTRYYVEGTKDETLTEDKAHVMYMDYMKSYKISDYISAPKYTSADGTETEVLTPGSKINVSLDVNKEIKDVTETVSAALYSGNKLVSVTKGIYDKESGRVTAGINVPAGISDAAVKVFGWDGISTIKPIMSADIFPKN